MRGGVIKLSASNTKKSKILSGLKIGACLFFLSTIMSSGAFAYTKQEDDMMRNFIEDNISRADRLTVSDIKKALPFMSDAEAKDWLLNMQKFLIEHKKNGPRLED